MRGSNRPSARARYRKVSGKRGSLRTLGMDAKNGEEVTRMPDNKPGQGQPGQGQPKPWQPGGGQSKPGQPQQPPKK